VYVAAFILDEGESFGEIFAGFPPTPLGDDLRPSHYPLHLPRMLTLQGTVAARLADWDIAIPAAEEARRRRVPEARDQLTAQELQIAQLAAEGLTNREIGQRLYLAHRTIGTHLYRTFPKLGMTTRNELRTVMPSCSAGTCETASA
jgi:DNA-binding CsgD family transcriptional regulator